MARSPSILLVEDNPDDAVLVSKAAQRILSGIPLSLVNNGFEAIRYLKGDGGYVDRAAFPFPDLVLLDLKLPLVNGFEVLGWIRSQDRLKRLPVIILSGSVLPEDTRRAYEAGANSYLAKPPDFDGMLKTMKDMGDFWLRGTMLPDTTM